MITQDKENTITTKLCVRCGSIKSIDEFYKARGHNDGLSSWCKVCHKNHSYQLSVKRKTSGKCTRCGGENLTGDCLCPSCSVKNNITGGARAKRLALDHKCPKCGGENPTSNYYCSTCDINRYHRETERKHKRISDGLCPVCGDQNTTNQYCCSDCKAIDSNSRHIRKANRVANGMCPLCGGEKPSDFYCCDTCRQKQNDRVNNRIKSNVQFRLATILRSRLHSALRGNAKTGSAVKDLGCTIDEFKIYLESQFYNGMQWSDLGSGLGHFQIHHCLEFNEVDLTDREQCLKVLHYTNQIPLWFEDHIAVHNKEKSVA